MTRSDSDSLLWLTSCAVDARRVQSCATTSTRARSTASPRSQVPSRPATRRTGYQIPHQSNLSRDARSGLPADSNRGAAIVAMSRVSGSFRPQTAQERHHPEPQRSVTGWVHVGARDGTQTEVSSPRATAYSDKMWILVCFGRWGVRVESEVGSLRIEPFAERRDESLTVNGWLDRGITRLLFGLAQSAARRVSV